MPGENLTRDEARARAGIVRNVAYHVDVDLTGTAGTFESRVRLTFDAEAGQYGQQALFNQVHQLTHTAFTPPHIQHEVHDQLAGAVISHLATAVALHHRNVTRRKQVFRLAGLALGEHAFVLQQPELIDSVGAAFGSERMHRRYHFLVGPQTQGAYVTGLAFHNTI